MEGVTVGDLLKGPEMNPEMDPVVEGIGSEMSPIQGQNRFRNEPLNKTNITTSMSQMRGSASAGGGTRERGGVAREGERNGATPTSKLHPDASLLLPSLLETLPAHSGHDPAIALHILSRRLHNGDNPNTLLAKAHGYAKYARYSVPAQAWLSSVVDAWKLPNFSFSRPRTVPGRFRSPSRSHNPPPALARPSEPSYRPSGSSPYDVFEQEKRRRVQEQYEQMRRKELERQAREFKRQEEEKAKREQEVEEFDESWFGRVVQMRKEFIAIGWTEGSDGKLIPPKP